MKIKKATLSLIKSVRSPVFETPMGIRYSVAPRVGQGFFFGPEYGFDRCNLSTVKKITKFKGFNIIQTRNSYYVLTHGGKSEC